MAGNNLESVHIILDELNRMLLRYDDRDRVSSSIYFSERNLLINELAPIHKCTYKEKSITCTICLNDFELLNDIRILPCSHSFHRECIDTWFKISLKCPNCNIILEK